MPYITSDERDVLDPSIDQLTQEIQTAGQRTYTVYRLAFDPAYALGSYTSMSRARATLKDAYDVLTDELLKYERKKKLENGGI